MAELDASNLINIGILLVTALVGILSGWAAREARRAQEAANAAAEEANRIQTRIVEIEEQRHQQEALAQKKAALTARLERASRSPAGRKVNHWDLLVKNTGAVAARNVAATINGVPLSVPELIDSGGEVRCSLPGRPDFDTELSWDDDTGEHRYWKSKLR